jgi:hypothetical protein
MISVQAIITVQDKVEEYRQKGVLDDRVEKLIMSLYNHGTKVAFMQVATL